MDKVYKKEKMEYGKGEEGGGYIAPIGKRGKRGGGKKKEIGKMEYKKGKEDG